MMSIAIDPVQSRIIANAQRMVVFLVISALFLFAMARESNAAPMSFTLLTASGVEGCYKTCQTVVVAQGEIDNGSAARLEALVTGTLGLKPVSAQNKTTARRKGSRRSRSGRKQRAPQNTAGPTILFSSTGGYVIAAAKLGIVFRKYRMTVVVAGAAWVNPQTLQVRMRAARCVSACVYAFMGGARRVVPPGSSIVLHRSYADRSWWQSRDYSNQVLQQYILSYAESMGVSSSIVSFAERLPPSKFYYVTGPQIAAWRLASPGF